MEKSTEPQPCTQWFVFFKDQLLMSEKLYPHLLEIDRAARERMEAMLSRMMEAAGITEELKARAPLRWVGLMNTLKAQAEEIVLSEIIFN